MPTQPMTLNVPEPLYQHLKHKAEQARRSVEEETLQVLAAAVPGEAGLPADISESLQALQTLGDADLWKAARHPLAREAGQELESLHHKRQGEGLSDSEEQHLAALLGQYERHLLVRAQAIALLKQRGQDVREFLPS